MSFNALRPSVLAIVALALASLAHSTTITLGGQASGTSGYTTNHAGALVTTFDDGLVPANYTVTHGSIVTGSLSNQYAPPTGDSTRYLTTGIGSVVINFGVAPIDYFGLYWSTIDDYNSIAFKQTNGTVQTFTGSSLGVTANGTQSDYVNFFSDTGVLWSSVTLSSPENAFEVDNIATATPEPASVAMVGLGIGLALVGVLRRRKVPTPDR